MATTLGSRRTIPLSLANTRVLAVPRSIPISFERNPKKRPIIRKEGNAGYVKLKG
jgi:hypothetical protein